MSSLIRQPFGEAVTSKRKLVDVEIDSFEESNRNTAKRRCSDETERRCIAISDPETEDSVRTSMSDSSAVNGGIQSRVHEQKFSTCFKRGYSSVVLEKLSPNVGTWTTDDVLTFMDLVISRLQHYCPEHDKKVIRSKGIDGKILYDIASNDSLVYEGYGLSPRAFVMLKFHCRHLLNISQDSRMRMKSARV